MSRKKSASKKITILDSKYKSPIIPKLINSLMFDGKKTIAEKIVYDAIDKIMKSSIEKVIVANTVQLSETKHFEKLEIISVAPLFANAIANIHSGESVSALFNV